MGLESFFIKVIFKDERPGYTNGHDVFTSKRIDVDNILKTVSNEFNTQIIERNDNSIVVLINDSLVLSFIKFNNILDVSFEGTFSWYEQNLQLICEVSQTMNRVEPLYLYYPQANYFEVEEEANIIAFIKKEYNMKYHKYKNTFNNFSKQVSVENFYQEYDKTKSFLKRFFKRPK